MRKILNKLLLFVFNLINLEVAGGKSSVKLKASDIYSDDSGSDSEDKRFGRRSSTSSHSSSESDDEDSAAKTVAGMIHFYFISE